MPPVIACPYCRQLTKVDPTWVGHAVSCPHCKQQFQVPELEPPPLPPAPALDLSADSPEGETSPIRRPTRPRRLAPKLILGGLIVLLAGVAPWLIWHLAREQAGDASQTEEEQAKAVLKKALDSWQLGDGRTKIATQQKLQIADAAFASGSLLLSYDMGAARLVQGDVPGLQPGQVGCQISVTLVRQTPDRKKVEEKKLYVLSRADEGRWRLGDANTLQSAELGKPASKPGDKKPALPGTDRKKELARLEEEAKKREAEKKQELARREADPRYWINFVTSLDEATRKEARQKLVAMGEAAVPALTQALEDDSVRVREIAAELLTLAGPKAKFAVLPLRKHARGGEAGLRKQCQAALEAIGPLQKSDLSLMMEALRYRDPELRRLALEELQKHGPDAAPARSFLLETLSGNDAPELKRAAVELLAQLPPKAAAYPLLIQASKSDSKELRVAAKLALQKLGPPPKEEINDLVSGLKSGSAEQRLATIEALRSAGPEARPAVTALAPFLKDPNATLRRAAVEFIGDFPAEGREHLPLLLKLARDSNSAVRVAATQAIAKLTPITKADVPRLSAALKDADAEQRQVAIETLVGLGNEAAAAIPILVERLDKAGEPPALKVLLIQALAKTGAPAKVAAPTLIQLLRLDPADEVRRAASEALAGFGTGVIPELIGVVKEGDEKAHALACTALARIGPPAVPPLIEALRAGPTEDRLPLAKALGVIGEPAVPALQQALKDKAFQVRMGACEALAQVGPQAKEAVPLLIDALTDDYTNVQRQAGRALEKIGVAAVPALIDAVRFSRRTRTRAVIVLGQIGPAAKEAIPVLTQTLKDEDEQTRLEAEKAIKRIQKK